MSRRNIGLAAPTFAFTGFGTQWLDYDNDGRLDLFIANGAVTIVESQRGSPYPYRQRNLLFHDEGDAEVSSRRATSRATRSSDSRSAVARRSATSTTTAAVDVLVTNNNGPVRLLHNEVGSGSTGSRCAWKASGAIGSALARVSALLRDGEDTVWRRVHTDSSYLSASDVRVHFGLGRSPNVRGVMVEWPDGSTERWDHIEADRLVTLKQGSGR